jgi:hypothetical protein
MTKPIHGRKEKTTMNANINITMNMNNTEANTSTKHHAGGLPKKVVMCKETGEIFNSATEAAKRFNVHISALTGACTGRQKTLKGMHFCYLDNENNPIEIEQPVKADKPKRIKEVTIQKEAIMTAEGKRDGGNCEPCMCITDGLCFTSMTDAAEHYGINVYQISYACKVPGRKAAGREFCSTKDISLHLNRFSEAINKANAYDILMEKDRMKREIIAKVDACQDNVLTMELKLCEAKQALEQARMELANFN